MGRRTGPLSETIGDAAPPDGMEPGSDDTLLGGRVRLRQPRGGLRAGLDAVMLAAAVPARDGETVAELGCGSGAAFLCVLARVGGARAVAVERDPALAALAARNVEANGWAARATVLTGDVSDPALPRALPAADHGLANPPWYDRSRATASAEPRRAAATHADAGGPRLADWAAALGRVVRPSGSATLVLPASLFADGLGALATAGFGALTLRPLWPREGLGARRVLVSGRRGSRAPARVLPGLVLHEGEGWSAAARAVLEDAAPLA